MNRLRKDKFKSIVAQKRLKFSGTFEAEHYSNALKNYDREFGDPLLSIVRIMVNYIGKAGGDN